MKIAYLILAHDNPEHLNKLINSLKSKNSLFFIHIDKKSSITDFGISDDKNVIFLKKRIKVYWGDFSIVRATILLMNESINYDQKFDYFVLLSGTHYPIQSIEYIENFFAKNQGKEYLNILPMSSKQNNKYGKPLKRLINYKTQSANILKKIFFIGLAFIKYKRNYKKYLGDLKPYGGSQWWALSRDACIYILEFINKNEAVVNFYVNTYIPDESFFHTILGNSKFREKMTHGLTYTDWSSRKLHPKEIAEKHLKVFELNHSMVVDDIYGKGELLFARKFTDKNKNAVEKLNKIIELKIKIPNINGTPK